jgi:hypothetical protein
VLGGEQAEFSDASVRVVRAPKGAAWSDCVVAYLRQIETPRVLIVLEDFFLRERVGARRLLLLEGLAEQHDLACLRLVCRPGPRSEDRWNNSGELGVLHVDAAYRVSTQAAIWRRDVLEALLVPGESAWEFEMRGSARAAKLFPAGFLGVYRDALPYGHHVVERGQWFPWDAWYFGRMDIGCDFARRGVMPWRQATRWLGRKGKDIALEPCPIAWRASLRNLFRVRA